MRYDPLPPVYEIARRSPGLRSPSAFLAHLTMRLLGYVIAATVLCTPPSADFAPPCRDGERHRSATHHVCNITSSFFFCFLFASFRPRLPYLNNYP
ncbi:hypothetical protein L218DRAFT_376273 [Marasmius fiardii PR-910]|nr:hypothetical protein L218DRAFT_376273 [Marasmius fiardii PR-910]